jgi:hypothetical protein
MLISKYWDLKTTRSVDSASIRAPLVSPEEAVRISKSTPTEPTRYSRKMVQLTLDHSTASFLKTIKSSYH